MSSEKATSRSILRVVVKVKIFELSGILNIDTGRTIDGMEPYESNVLYLPNYWISIQY